MANRAWRFVEMKYLCFLYLLVIRIFVTADGECLRIETNYGTYPCTEEVKRATGCWDEDGHTQLCGASFIQVDR